MKTWIKNFIRKRQFFPDWLGVFVNPFYLGRASLATAVAEFAHSLSGRLLDVGCGSKPYRFLFHVSDYVGLDIDSDISRNRGAADLYYDGSVFPVDSASFDVVLCNQVLEHVFNPEFFLAEVTRVLKPGGKLLLTVPFVWDEHEQPHDYARYSTFGLFYLLKKAGLEIIEHRKLCSDASVVAQIANAYLYKITNPLPSWCRVFLTVTLMAFVNIAGLLARWILPSNPDLFLDHAVLAVKRP